MTFINSILTCLSWSFTYSGRASRSEFWWFMLLSSIIIGEKIFTLFFQAAGNEESAMGMGLLSSVLNILLMILLIFPSLAVGARRLHDIGRSGWWQLIMITIIGYLVLIFFWVQESQQEDNDFGQMPQLIQSE